MPRPERAGRPRVEGDREEGVGEPHQRAALEARPGTLPEGYSVRSASARDIPVIVDLLNAYDEWEFGEPDSHPEQLVDDFETPGFDPATDSWLVSGSADQAVAFVLYESGEAGHEGATGFGRVHPRHQGHGLGGFLVDVVERRWVTEATGRRAEVLRHWVNENDPGAADLLSARGYELARREYHLERSLADIPEAVPPNGIAFERFEPGKERDLHLVETEAFAEHWGYRPVPFEEWASFLRSPSFQADLTLVANDAGEPVGTVLPMVQEDGGWVNVLGVRPAWRGRGIGRALLLAGFTGLAARGCTVVKLTVDAGNESGALRLYERVGMRVRREWHVYEKGLGAAD